MACLSPLGRWMVEHIYDVCSSCGNISMTEEYDICLYCHEMWVMEEHGIKGSNPWKRVISFPYSVRDICLYRLFILCFYIIKITKNDI